MIQIKVNNDQLQTALQQALAKANNLQPALQDVGEKLIQSTRQRFAEKKAPDGTPWQANAPSTQAQKGRNDPLIGEGGSHGGLLGSFHAQASPTALILGTGMEYAAMQHFGGSPADHPHLWAAIPARPFLGISNTDTDNILQILRDFLTPN